jgi:hypothetical protein
MAALRSVVQIAGGSGRWIRKPIKAERSDSPTFGKLLFTLDGVRKCASHD